MLKLGYRYRQSRLAYPDGLSNPEIDLNKFFLSIETFIQKILYKTVGDEIVETNEVSQVASKVLGEIHSILDIQYFPNE